jgi:branched-chain amino acid transport system substrate-binding protein
MRSSQCGGLKRPPGANDQAITPLVGRRTNKTEDQLRSWICRILRTASVGLLALAPGLAPAVAQSNHGPGVTDTEIKIGNTVPYSGPGSSYSVLGKTLAAFFKMVNDNGGINGRKINFISYDDAYSPPKTVEQVRKLVEGDEVFLLFYSFGTATNSAVQKYLNTKKVPQLFVATGASRWGDPQHFPWTMGWAPSYRSEARVYATYILRNHPDAKLGILYQNDDLGKDYLAGLHDVLGENYARMVVAESPFDITAPTIDSQVVAIKSANPDIFINFATAKFAAQAIKKIAELGWHPIQIMSNASASIALTLKPAGLDNAKGILSASYQKDVSDPQWQDDPAIKGYLAFLAKYLPDADKTDVAAFNTYSAALGIVQVLKQCGDELTRENVMKQAANLDFALGTYLPGIRVKTGPTDYYPIEQLQLMRFNGENWIHFGEVIDGHMSEPGHE